MSPPSLDSIPPELIIHIAEYLGIKDLNSLVRVSRRFHSLLSSQLYTLGASWAPDPDPYAEDKIITPLAWCFRNGQHAAAHRLLSKNASPTLAAGDTTAIHEAVEGDYLDNLRLMLDRPYNPADLENDLDETPLMTAARLGREACARALLESGRGEELYFPLSVAVEESQEDIVRLILSFTPPRSDFSDNMIQSLMTTAVENGHSGILRQLLDYAVVASSGFDINVATFSHVSRGNTACIDAMFEYGADMDYRAGWEWTHLHSAVSSHNYDVVTQLIGMGADIDAVDRSGCTPMMIAAQLPDERMALLLLDHGARIDLVSDCGVNVLQNGASHGLTRLVERLHRAGLSVHTPAGDGSTALHYAAFCPHAEDTIKYLLGAGADVAARESNGQTPLHHAARAGNTNIARVLIAAGAPLNAVDAKAKTPLHYATTLQYTECAQLLQEEIRKEEEALDKQMRLVKWLPKLHADGTTTYWNAGSALHDVVANGQQEERVELLLSEQRDIHFRDLYGRTVLDWVPAYQPSLRRKIVARWGEHPQAPDIAQQTEMLKRSIAIFANNILLSPPSPTRDKTLYQKNLYMLGKCLLYLDNEDAARTAFALQGRPLERENASYEAVNCKRCRRTPTVELGWWVCKTCPQIDLCHVCAPQYADFMSASLACVAHQFLEVRAADQDGLEVGEDRELSVKKEWLEGLIKLYGT